MLRQLDDLQERLRKQIESADIKTRALGECSIENSLLRDLLVTYQRLLLEIYDKATALVKLHRSTVGGVSGSQGKSESP